MSDAVVGGLMGEIRRHPYTSVTALACLGACLFGLPTVWYQKADAGDVQSLATQMVELRDTVKRESTQGELNNVQRELFAISMRIVELERANLPVDTLLYQRRDVLQAQQRQLEAQLASLGPGKKQ